MYNIERKSEIINILEQNGKAYVNELAERFHASKETIRRDLREMEEDGVLKRTHGGAVLQSTNAAAPSEYPVSVREIQRYQEKNAICKRAASHIRDGDIVFADNSSTCIYLTRYIPADIRVTILTNSIKLMLESLNHRNPNHLIMCLGGVFNGSNLSLYGNMTLKTAGEFRPNKAFMSCTGIHPQSQLADSSVLEVDTKRLMIERAQEVYILADHSKFERSGQVYLCDISEVDYVITDNKTKKEDAAFLNEQGVELIIAQEQIDN